MRSIQNFISI